MGSPHMDTVLCIRQGLILELSLVNPLGTEVEIVADIDRTGIEQVLTDNFEQLIMLSCLKSKQ